MANSDLKEPMVPINGTGMGVKIKDIITIGTLIFIGGGAYFLVDYKLDLLDKNIARNAISIEKQISIFSKSVDDKVAILNKNVDDAREERLSDIRDLRKTVSENKAEAARVREQVSNLQILMGDIRNLLRDQNKK